jgi:uncharacterized protein YggE
VRLVLKDADKLETAKLIETVIRLIDTARESGLQIGQINPNNVNAYSTTPAPPPPPLIVCKASNNAAVREQAYKAAIEDARKKATVLALLSGVKIGKVVGIQEMDGPVGAAQAAQAPGQSPDSEISSVLLGELSLNVRLGVRFEIVN